MLMQASRKSKKSITNCPRSLVWIPAVFLFGFLFGFTVRGAINTPSRLVQEESLILKRRKGSLVHISQVARRSTSHVDGKGRPITKQQLLDPFEIPSITGVSVATVKAGQTISQHSHESMVELFYVLSGSGTVDIDEKQTRISKGHFIEVVPGERHSFSVDPTAAEDLIMILCGIATGPKTSR